MAVAEPSPRLEAQLYISWMRAAAGRWSLADDLPSALPLVERLVSPPPVARSEAIEAASPSVAIPPSESADPFDDLRREALACRRCGLCETRNTVVFGEGNRRPRLMVVGEAPGADEDATGRPFVGKAGQLLTRMLAAIGLSRDDVYIGNVLKCRPPDNRSPRPDEVATCRPYLEEQMRLLDPSLVLVLGNHAAHAVLGTDRGISRIRGQVTLSPEGRKVLPTYHPAYLLRNPDAKREAWLDLQLAAKTLGLTLPGG